jgi:hypothetical protein
MELCLPRDCLLMQRIRDETGEGQRQPVCAGRGRWVDGAAHVVENGYEVHGCLQEGAIAHPRLGRA